MLGLVIRVVLSLAVVLGLFWVVARTGSRKLGGRDRALIRVRGRQSLSRGSSLAVVEVGTRVLVVGVSDGGVRLLTELDPDDVAPTALAGPVADDEPLPVPDTLPVAEALPVDEALPVAEGFAAAFERACAATAPLLTDPADAHPTAESAPPRRAVDTGAALPAAEGPLAGSLLSATTWRQAWDTATGRSHRVRRGDAA